MISEYPRRRLLKIIAGGVLSLIGGLFGSSNKLSKLKKTIEHIKINKTSILSKISLPETGPWPTEDPFYFVFITMITTRQQKMIYHLMYPCPEDI